MSDSEINKYNIKYGKQGNYLQITLIDGSNKNILFNAELKNCYKDNTNKNMVVYLY